MSDGSWCRERGFGGGQNPVGHQVSGPSVRLDCSKSGCSAPNSEVAKIVSGPDFR
jgi:hypothetical protein